MVRISVKPRPFVRLIFLFGVLSLSACTAAISHVPSSELQDLKLQPPPRIIVADIGDVREDEEPNAIGQGFSEWIPLVYYATDKDGKDLPVAFYIAESLSEDLQKLGYVATLANDPDSRKPVTADDALAAARTQGADYLLTTKITDGKTNFWGFLLIPFMEPVWSRIGYDVQLYDVKTGTTGAPEHAFHKDTEWYFGKITITDSVIDAPLFGPSWIENVWGKTLVSAALADTAKRISAEVQARQTGPAAPPGTVISR